MNPAVRRALALLAAFASVLLAAVALLARPANFGDLVAFSAIAAACGVLVLAL